MSALETTRAEAKGSRAEATAIRARARVAFEKAVYATEPTQIPDEVGASPFNVRF
jgi:hypothetical protein